MKHARTIRTQPGVALALALAIVGLVPLAAHAQTPPTPVDTLDVRTILERRSSALDSLLLPTSTEFDTVGLKTLADSLDRGGAAAVAAQRKAAAQGRSVFSLGWEPFALWDYQRVDGFRLGTGISPTLGRYCRADLAVGYGFSSKDWAARGQLEFGKSRGPVGAIGWSELAVPFGPTPPGQSLGFMALVLGQDRRDYVRRREVVAAFWPWRRPGSWLRLRGFDRRDRTLEAATDFSFVGSDRVPMGDPNPAVDDLDTYGGQLTLQLGTSEDRAGLRVDAGLADGDFEWAWQEVRARLGQIVPGGTLWLELGGANRAGTPPVQEAAYLGGDDNLRGFERLEFAGKRRATGRIEYACGIDLLARTRIPLVERAHLQFIPWVDAGTTWGETRGVATTRGTLEGDARASYGLGFQRTLWIPGLWALRFDVTRRTDGADDPWGWWLRVVDIEP